MILWATHYTYCSIFTKKMIQPNDYKFRENICTACQSYTTPCPEKGATLFLPVTPRNANRFSQFFHHHTLQ